MKTYYSNNELKSKEVLLSIDELAEYLEVSRAMILSWVKRRKIPFYRVGPNLHFKKSEILKGY